MPPRKDGGVAVGSLAAVVIAADVAGNSSGEKAFKALFGVCWHSVFLVGFGFSAGDEKVDSAAAFNPAASLPFVALYSFSFLVLRNAVMR